MRRSEISNDIYRCTFILCDKNFIETFSCGSNWQLIGIEAYGLAPNRRQAIVRINVDHDHSYYMASLDLNALIKWGLLCAQM